VTGQFAIVPDGLSVITGNFCPNRGSQKTRVSEPSEPDGSAFLVEYPNLTLDELLERLSVLAVSND